MAFGRAGEKPMNQSQSDVFKLLDWFVGGENETTKKRKEEKITGEWKLVLSITLRNQMYENCRLGLQVSRIYF